MTYGAIDPTALRRFRRALLRWGTPPRRRFGWRRGQPSAFRVLVTEMLLSRTRAEAVEPVVVRLLRKYPTAAALARAPRADVEAILRPLGLFRKRARLLVACAAALVERHRGVVPRTQDALLRLPYVGRYCASAVRCFAFGERAAVVDANVARVYRRVFALPPPPRHLKMAHDLWAVAQRLLPRKQVREFTWALLDLGGAVCKPRTPACHACPVARLCAAHRAGTCGCIPAANVTLSDSRWTSPELV
jgi:A/G-specific adenine glycosylase